MDNPKNRVGLIFSMPLNGDLKIYSSQPIDDLEIDDNEEIEGIYYYISWNEKKLPWYFSTQLQAMICAISCQWAAKSMIERLNLS